MNKFNLINPPPQFNGRALSPVKASFTIIRQWDESHSKSPGGGGSGCFLGTAYSRAGGEGGNGAVLFHY
ncbi:MAG: hypothetical protein JSS94_06320 [Bacteroidetes bacterium]|nr:hypothetical protein [Bacteroidota bacterium]